MEREGGEAKKFLRQKGRVGHHCLACFQAYWIRVCEGRGLEEGGRQALEKRDFISGDRSFGGWGRVWLVLSPSHSIPGEETTFPICGTLLLLLLPFPILFSHELSYATAVCGRKFLKLVPSFLPFGGGISSPFSSRAWERPHLTSSSIGEGRKDVFCPLETGPLLKAARATPLSFLTILPGRKSCKV